MVKATKCARCKNYIILNFKKEAQNTVCPYCDKLFRYRLIGASICEIDLLIGEVLGKGIPRKRSVFGGLASPARFERAASRLGAHGSIDKKA